jgi:virginiamycin B lyase
MKRSRSGWQVLRSIAVAMFFALSGLAVAQDSQPAAAQIVEYSAGISAGAFPTYITAGPDGNLWFAEVGVNQIARITPDGVVTEFSAGITLNSGPTGITAGPDGNLWFTEQGASGVPAAIGRITPAGVVTEFRTGLDTNATPFGITKGPDGNLWFTLTEFTGSHTLGKIGRITTSGVITEFANGISPDSGPLLITTGADRNLWFSEEAVPGMANITTSGVVTEFKTGFDTNAYVWGVSRAPDGNVWFTKSFNPFKQPTAAIGKITPAGMVTEYPLTNTMADPRGMVYYRGSLWFTEYGADKIGRANAKGMVREIGGITQFGAPYAICVGPDGNLWFTELFGNRIGKLILP